MKTPICPLCEYTPDLVLDWDKYLIQHVVNIHGWSLQDAEDYVEGRPYKEVKQ